MVLDDHVLLKLCDTSSGRSTASGWSGKLRDVRSPDSAVSRAKHGIAPAGRPSTWGE
jgi:hypothetical protein